MKEFLHRMYHPYMYGYYTTLQIIVIQLFCDLSFFNVLWKNFSLQIIIK